MYDNLNFAGFPAKSAKLIVLNDKEETINQVSGKDKADGDHSVDEITGIVIVRNNF